MLQLWLQKPDSQRLAGRRSLRAARKQPVAAVPPYSLWGVSEPGAGRPCCACLAPDCLPPAPAAAASCRGRELDCELKQFRLAGDALMEMGAALELRWVGRKKRESRQLSHLKGNRERGTAGLV